jgi:hypothetical protein
MSGTPYTHADHVKACQIAAKQGVSLQAWVQVKTCGSAHCASILDGWTAADGGDFWKLKVTQPMRFTGSFPVKAVRQCSGLDGLCICAGESVNSSPEAVAAFAVATA